MNEQKSLKIWESELELVQKDLNKFCLLETIGNELISKEDCKILKGNCFRHILFSSH